jgi:hypothetical protein
MFEIDGAGGNLKGNTASSNDCVLYSCGYCVRSVELQIGLGFSLSILTDMQTIEYIHTLRLAHPHMEHAVSQDIRAHISLFAMQTIRTHIGLYTRTLRLAPPSMLCCVKGLTRDQHKLIATGPQHNTI